MKKPYFLFLICLFLVLDMTSFSFLAPILPDLILSRHINLSMVGFIFSFYPVSYFFVSLYLGKNLFLYNKRKLLINCQILLVLANILFALLDLVNSNIMLILLSILSRLIQGLAIGGACSILYAYVPDLYPREQEETFAIIEMSVGVGISIGPVLGGIFYSYLDYETSFLLITVIYMLFSIVFILLMRQDSYHTLQDISPTSPASPFLSNDSSSLEDSPYKKFNALEIDSIDEPLKLSYSVIFRNRSFFLTFLVYCISYTSITLIQPTFSDHMHSFGYDSDAVGFLFALCDLSYALTSLVLIRLFRYFKRKHLFVFGGALTAFALLLLGPEELTFLPKNVYVIGIGMVLFGVSQVFYNATIIPEFIDLLVEMYGFQKGINEMGSGIYNAGLAISEFFGPLLGGIFADNFGFARGLSLYAIFLCFYLVIYGVFIRRPKRIERLKTIEEVPGLEELDIS